MTASFSRTNTQALPAPFILVAENHQPTIEILTQLARERGILIRIVHDGDQAIEILKRITPLGAMLSVELGTPNGIDVCARMKHLRRLRDVPVILMSNTHDTRIHDASRMVRADSLLIKPFDHSRLIKVLERIAFGTASASLEASLNTQLINPRLTQIR